MDQAMGNSFYARVDYFYRARASMCRNCSTNPGRW